MNDFKINSRIAQRVTGQKDEINVKNEPKKDFFFGVLTGICVLAAVMLVTSLSITLYKSITAPDMVLSRDTMLKLYNSESQSFKMYVSLNDAHFLDTECWFSLDDLDKARSYSLYTKVSIPYREGPSRVLSFNIEDEDGNILHSETLDIFTEEATKHFYVIKIPRLIVDSEVVGGQ